MYIGVRSSIVVPEDDIGKHYFSSSKNEEFRERQIVCPHDYLYEVLDTFDVRKEAEDYEEYIHLQLDVAGSENFYNRRNANSNGFGSREGYVTVKDKDGIFYSVEVDDPRYLSG